MRRVLASMLLLGGCQNLIDLRERHFEDAGAREDATVTSEDGAISADARVQGDAAIDLPDTGPKPNAVECGAYCELMMGSATAAARCGASYSSAEACKQTCLTFEVGTLGDDPLDPTDGKRNTLACRQAYAMRAAPMSPDTDMNCLNAGPGGNGICGSNCESYCNLFAQACPGEFKDQGLNLASCTQKCAALRDHAGLNAANGADHEGDTVQCRLVHASNAAAYNATSPGVTNIHCGHAALRTTEYCADMPTSPTYCETYCTLVATACVGPQQLYDNKTQCLKTCAALDPGTDPIGETTGNTVACRIYHGYNALLTADSHCGHAGAGGWDGAHCGDECASFCKLASKGCGEIFTKKYGDEDKCRATCKPLLSMYPANYQGYNVSFEQSAGLPKKLYGAVKALETGDTTFCNQALADQ